MHLGSRSRTLITGGAGFVGSHLAEELLERDWEVEVIDDLSTGSIENIAHLKEDPRFSYTIDSVMNRGLLAELIDRADAVFHLAAAVGVRLIVERPVHTIRTNIEATELVLEFAGKKNKRVLVASTSEVYGKGNGKLLHEDCDAVLGPTTQPRWSYAASKIIDEYLALAYAGEQGLPVTVLRLFNTVGPRQTGQYGMVIPRFVTQALRDEPITVYGDGTQRRSFSWVRDVTAAMVDLIEHPDACGHVFNVGHGKDISIYELACLVKEMCESESEIVFVPFSEVYGESFEDINKRCPDISKLGDLIGYAPTLDLADMLREIITYYRPRVIPLEPQPEVLDLRVSGFRG